ncbi:hypothetical protein JXVLWARM_CDS_0099 [Burkholderia phage Bm1]
MKKLVSALLLFAASVGVLAQNYPSPTYKTVTINGATPTAPFAVFGTTSVTDSGRSNNDNTPTIGVNVSEALNYTSSYVTHYGFMLNATQLAGGTGDRIGVGSVQTCNGTLAGKSCVGMSGLAVPAGSTQGNFTGINARSLVPAGLTGPIGAAVAFEADVETHSPVLIRNGVRVAGENMSGGTTTHGSVEDAGIALVTDSGVNNDGFKIGLLFGETAQGYPNNWPILPGGTYWQAYSPTVQAAYGIDWTGSTAGWSKYAIALPQNTTGADIAWGTAGTAGIIGSTATTNGGSIAFTDTGTLVNNPSGGSLLNIGGSTGADVINNGYMTQASLTGYVQCNGSAGRCTASNTLSPSGGIYQNGGSTTAVDVTGNAGSGLYASGAGSYFTYYPNAGWQSGDHQRAQFLMVNDTSQDASVSEIGHAINMYSATGYAATYANNTAYSLGAYVDNTNSANLYKVTVAGTSAASGTGPSCTSGTCTDGTVTFQYVGNDIVNGKIGQFISHVATSGAGHVWGSTTDLVMASGWRGGFAASAEFDVTNNSGADCSTCQAVFVTGSPGPNKIGAGISIYNPSPTYYAYTNAININGSKVATNADINLNTTAQYAVADTGTRTTGLQMSGTYSSGYMLAGNGNVQIQQDYGRLNIFPSSSSNLHRWRFISNINGSGDGSIVVQHSNDNFASNFQTPATFNPDGSTVLGGATTVNGSLSVTNGSDVITANNNANNVLVFTGTGSSTAKSLATLNMGGHIASYDGNVGDGVAFKSDYYNTAVFQGLNSSGTAGYDTNLTLYRPSSTNNAFIGVTMSPTPGAEQHLWMGTDYSNSRYVFTQTVTGTGSYLPVVFRNGQGTAFTVGTGTTPTTTFVGGGIVLGAAEGNQATWSLGGQIWQWNMASGGNFYIHDGTNNKFPFTVVPNSSVTFNIGASSTTTNSPLTVTGAVTGTTVTGTNGVVLPSFTVSTLPTCNSGTKNYMVAVSDASSPTYNGSLTGGGSTAIPVFCNGSAWTAH